MAKAEQQRIHAGLLRILGLGFGIAVVIGGVVGQGIMRTPGIVAGGVPNAELIVVGWVLGGLLALVDSFASMELAASVPRAGGPYVFARKAFGPLASTLIGWADWLKGMTVLAFLSIVFAEYLHRLGWLGELSTSVLAAGLLALVWGLNLLGTRISGWSQNLGSALKALALLALVLLLFLAAPGAREPIELASHPALTVAGFVVAIRAVYTTYDGWNTAIYFCEEVHAPEQNIARATFIGLLIISFLYVLVNLGLLHVPKISEIASSKLPLADAASVVGVERRSPFSRSARSRQSRIYRRCS